MSRRVEVDCAGFFTCKDFLLFPQSIVDKAGTENCNSYPNIIRALSCSTNFCSAGKTIVISYSFKTLSYLWSWGKINFLCHALGGKMNGICLISNRWILHQFNEKAWSRAKMHPDDSSWVFGRKAFIKCIILIILIPLFKYNFSLLNLIGTRYAYKCIK